MGVSMEMPSFTMPSFQSARGQVVAWWKYWKFQVHCPKARRESAHARTFDGDFELKILRMRGFSSRFWTMDLKFPVLEWRPDTIASSVIQFSTAST